MSSVNALSCTSPFAALPGGAATRQGCLRAFLSSELPINRSTAAMFRSNVPRNGEVQRHPLKNGQVPQRSGPSALYPHRLSFYERPPLEEVTIEEFENYALDRLRGAEALLNGG